jgi:hypothetical protein
MALAKYLLLVDASANASLDSMCSEPTNRIRALLRAWMPDTRTTSEPVNTRLDTGCSSASVEHAVMGYGGS